MRGDDGGFFAMRAAQNEELAHDDHEKPSETHGELLASPGNNAGDSGEFWQEHESSKEGRVEQKRLELKFHE